jgi:formylglycine-generating enzyme
MFKTSNVRNLIILASCAALIASCKGGLGGKKKQKSATTGWNYNDKTQGGFYVPKGKEQKTGPGLVLVTGGTFTMGAKEEDVMAIHDNTPRRKTVNSFYMDETEVRNLDYREYTQWLGIAFGTEEYTEMLRKANPDSLVWRSELGYNEPYVEYYFRHPGFNEYPVVGVNWQQAADYCIWRTDRVNEKMMVEKGFSDKKTLDPKSFKNKKDQTFNTKSFLMNGDGVKKNPKNKSLTDAAGKPRLPNLSDGVLLPEYRLPFESEWEYAAIGQILENPNPSRKEGQRGEELISNKQVYSWSSKYKGLRDNRRGSWQGRMLANFKRGNGDYMGVAGGLNDRSAYTENVRSFLPNGFGLYNMSGNVSEWCFDVYRAMNNEDIDDLAGMRGNVFKTPVKDPSTGKYKKDSLGRIVYEKQSDSALVNRRNYQTAYAINYLDGDSSSNATYGYGLTTLVSDKSRVYKGGSWADFPYWLSPGTRRYLEEDQASSTIGFRCAMDRMGSPEGNGRKGGQWFKSKRQNSRKRVG